MERAAKIGVVRALNQRTGHLETQWKLNFDKRSRLRAWRRSSYGTWELKYVAELDLQLLKSVLELLESSSE